ncbi:unnamed protein product [Mytilus edulis]|uniref:Uncharacterized protein n=1 Tax=Mytilus edulis TaxID=6550 RepID=A0A8S3QJD1_MYTED|nr:unnamed protein product [Mytilus edulis]
MVLKVGLLIVHSYNFTEDDNIPKVKLSHQARGSLTAADSRVDLCEDIPPNNLTNGAVTVTERTIGSTANFTCDAGHSLVGNETITCTSSGWNGNIPQCISILCPETIAFFRGSKYIFSCGQRTWPNSEANCIASGGHLASIETAEENTFLLDVFVLMQNILSIPAFFWIGLTDNNDEMSYKWLSGEPLNFSNWYQGPPQQPDNKDYDGQLGAHCVMINTDYSFKWNDEFVAIYHYSLFVKFGKKN